MKQSWVNIEIAPAEEVTIETLPDKTIALRWNGVGLTVLLSKAELAELVRDANDVLMLA